MSVVFKEYAIRLNGARFPNLDILHLSDFHLRGPNAALEKALRRETAGRRYDLAFLTGDLVDEKRGLAPFMEYSSLIKARYGTFAVWGNHDRERLGLRHFFIFTENSVDSVPKSAIREELQSRMTGKEIRILSDGLEVIAVGSHKVHIVGLDVMIGVDRLQNWHRYKDRIDRIKGLLSAIPRGDLTIVLSHAPDIIEKLRGLKIDVMFTGHTHGGQIRLPFFGPLIAWSPFQRKYNRGLYEYNGGWLHVNPGLGTSRFTPVRFNCPPEISLVRIEGAVL
ncbi:MAG: metallophosphoesterase [Candidatus Omnitrophica bacterium]|nr:metallophosphoesterase [Candidatus Omnitrophota bacterium]